MKFIYFNGQLALTERNRVLGWVLLTVDGMYTLSVKGKPQNKSEKRLYKEKKPAMMALYRIVKEMKDE